MKEWIGKGVKLLNKSLLPIPQELNELDWKEGLSSNNEKLAHHLSAFANHPGGGYMIFGIKNSDGKPVGIDKSKVTEYIQRLSNISRDALDPLVKIDHSVETYENVPLLFIYVHESSVKPVHIKTRTIEDSYIRSGGTTRKASRHEIGALLLNSKSVRWEELHASKLITAREVLTLLDYKTIFSLLKHPVPLQPDELLNWMIKEKMISKVETDGFYITNFGAIASAENLNEFDDLSRKTIRLIKYKGINKLDTEKEFPGQKGYAIGFEGLIEFLKALLPQSEIIKNALRSEVTVYPELALRELIANALIHQDFTIQGKGPMIEIFDNRIEISNPGRLLPSKNIDRLIGTNPESRNEILAKAFRRYNICEERGTGLIKTIISLEVYGLPALNFEEGENYFKVTLYSPRKFANMSIQERVDACYQHSIIKYMAGGAMTNTSLRERFKMHEKQRPMVSKLIKVTLERGKIKFKNPENISDKFAEYIPFWA
ncbi:MAG: putative DNA binding domain-containing protein [Ignavibacteriaceae bacterium]|nr:putative DNA binding domain-containing protein [Ignavibacteriaceae bacterium]